MGSLNDVVICLIPGAPLFAALLVGLLGQFVRPAASHRAVVAALVVSTCASVVTALVLLPNEMAGSGSTGVLTVPIYEWFHVGGLVVRADLRVDAMTSLMLMMVTGVSTLVAIYASSYMHGDAGYGRFFACISLFVFCMCMLVMAGNFLLMFLFWEGVGLCSYLLIGYYQQKPSAAAAAKKAFVVNRIGDFGLILGVFLIYTLFGTLSYDEILTQPDVIQKVATNHAGALSLVGILLFVGAVGKSAQFPLAVWLPDAMEGPTPVSALIHAATMVTAGVYLVARCLPLYAYAPVVLLGISVIGAITALTAAIMALAQYDLKRVLAYSTVSQLGFMFMSLGAGGADESLLVPAATFAMFHMFTHAFFKAVLFLSAGSVMHSMGDVIDMRQFSGLRRALPLTHFTFLAGALALAGFPFLSGFWSKDEILTVLSAATTNASYGWVYQVILYVAMLSSLLTAFYTFRAYFLTFHGPERFPAEAGSHPHDAPPVMAIPLLVLALGAVFVGVLLGPTHYYGAYLHTTAGWPHAAELPMNLGVLASSAAIALLGIGAAWAIYASESRRSYDVSASPGFLSSLSIEGLYFDKLYLATIVMPLRGLGAVATWIDRFVLDCIVDSVGYIPKLFGDVLRPLQGGLIQVYGLAMLGGVVAALISVLAVLARATQ